MQLSPSRFSNPGKACRRDRHLQKQDGFTLIELLAAVALFALVAVMAFGGLSNLSLARDRIETTLSDTAAIQSAIWRIQNDFEQIRHRSVRDDFGDSEPAFSTNESVAGVLFTRGGRRNPLDLPYASLQRVAYLVEDGDLIRRAWPTLDRAQETDPRNDVLISEVENLRWRFLGAAGEWHDSWPPLRAANAQSSEPPKAVELSFDSATVGDIRLLFRTLSSSISNANTGTGTGTGTGS